MKPLPPLPSLHLDPLYSSALRAPLSFLSPSYKDVTHKSLLPMADPALGIQEVLKAQGEALQTILGTLLALVSEHLEHEGARRRLLEDREKSLQRENFQLRDRLGLNAPAACPSGSVPANNDDYQGQPRRVGTPKVSPLSPPALVVGGAASHTSRPQRMLSSETSSREDRKANGSSLGDPQDMDIRAMFGFLLSKLDELTKATTEPPSHVHRGQGQQNDGPAQPALGGSLPPFCSRSLHTAAVSPGGDAAAGDHPATTTLSSLTNHAGGSVMILNPCSESPTPASARPSLLGDVEEIKAPKSCLSKKDMRRCSSNLSYVYFEVLHVWQSKYRNPKSNRTRGPSIPLDEQEQPEIKEQSEIRSARSRLVIRPNSMYRFTWDMMGTILICYDCIIIPVQNCFEIADNVPVTWTCRFFWTGDIPLSFLTGFLRSNGEAEMRLPQIVRRYIRTWLVIDLLVVVGDWVELFLQNMSGFEFAKFVKITRFMRIFRLARLLKISRVAHFVHYIGQGLSERITLAFNIITSIFALLYAAHINACVWYGIASVFWDGIMGTSWISAKDVVYETLATRYLVSFHWAIAQFVGGMDEVVPVGNIERTYAIFSLLLAFVVASIFTSSLTSSITRLHIIRGVEHSNFARLREYLVQKSISRDLMMRIQRNAHYVTKEDRSSMQESNVHLLRIVSEPLRAELHFEVHCPVFADHPFLGLYCQKCPLAMRKICHTAISMRQMAAGDTLFTIGELPNPPQMFFVVKGTLRYVEEVSEAGSSSFGCDLSEGIEVSEGMWLSEGTLWTAWMHQGRVTAATECQILSLDAKQFQEIAAQFVSGDADCDPRTYATQFVGLLNTSENRVRDVGGPEEVQTPVRPSKAGPSGGLSAGAAVPSLGP